MVRRVAQSNINRPLPNRRTVEGSGFGAYGVRNSWAKFPPLDVRTQLQSPVTTDHWIAGFQPPSTADCAEFTASSTASRNVKFSKAALGLSTQSVKFQVPTLPAIRLARWLI